MNGQIKEGITSEPRQQLMTQRNHKTIAYKLTCKSFDIQVNFASTLEIPFGLSDWWIRVHFYR